jgi:predicted Zn-dependent protease
MYIINGEVWLPKIMQKGMRIAVYFNHADKKLALFFLVFLFFLTVDSMQGSARASLSLADEKKLGKEFYEKLEKLNVLSTNERANTFLGLLGERILIHSDKAPFEFKFSIIQSSAINAFATPGGYVYVNQGLINLVENEAQLAGVLAHEIAHVNGRHIAEILDKSKIISLSALAAILAGAFLGGSGDAAAAITSFSIATATALSLKYSREQEEAADRMGISYLVEAGYSGVAILDFLKIMRRYEFYSNSIPSYFLTHPGTDERARYIDALLQTTYTSKGAESIFGYLKRVQTILLLSGKTADSANLQHFKQILNDKPGDVDALYGLAFTQYRLGMVNESLDTFRKVLRLAPDDAEILRDMGIASYKLGQFTDAEAFLNRALVINEKDADTFLYLGRTYEALGDMPRALSLYKKLEEKHLDGQETFYNLAMAYGKANQLGDSHYYFGLYFKKKGKTDSALFHFKAAIKHLPPDAAQSQKIAKEIESLKR